MARGDFPSAKQDQFNLRLPDGMRDQIAAEARKTGRSMNAEIVHRLAGSLNFPRFEDAGFDFGLGFDEDLNFELLNEAARNDRTPAAEIAYRLKRSFEPDILNQLEDITWKAKRDLDQVMRLFIQMTPEERLILEERADIIERAKLFELTPKKLARWTELRRIGGKGRMILTKPPVDYSQLLPRNSRGERPEDSDASND